MDTGFVRIADMAVATDGGSVTLALERADGSTAWLLLNRSLEALGGPDYNRVSLDGEMLSDKASAEILAEVVRLIPFLID